MRLPEVPYKLENTNGNSHIYDIWAGAHGSIVGRDTMLQGERSQVQ
jgi:hypothetical protein